MLKFFFDALTSIADNTVLVLAVGAAIALVVKFETRIPERYKKWVFITDVGFIACSLLLGALKNHLDTKWQKGVEDKIIHSQKAAEVAKVEAAALFKKLEAEEARYAELESRARLLEEKQKDRSISSHERSEFIGHVLHSTKSKIEVHYLSGESGEPRRFAQQIATLLDDAGYHFVKSKDDLTGFLMTGDSVGVHLRIKSRESVPDGTAELQKAFEAISIPAPAEIISNVPDGVIHVVVLRKP